MKWYKLGKILLVLNFFFWIGYNFYFGWNLTAQSELEGLLDDIFSFLTLVGFVFIFVPLLDMWDKKVRDFYGIEK